jgi:hypothetical protein
VPKVDRCPPRRQRRGVHPAICWELRVSGATRSSATSSDNASGADNQQERPACHGRAGILRDHTPDIRERSRMMRWSPLHGDMQGRRGVDQGRAVRSVDAI